MLAYSYYEYNNFKASKTNEEINNIIKHWALFVSSDKYQSLKSMKGFPLYKVRKLANQFTNE